MKKYIDSDVAVKQIDQSLSRVFVTPVGKSIVDKMPAADVVTSDCYNKVLWENDIMREQLASIGKGFAENMQDVKKITRPHGRLIDAEYLTEHIKACFQNGREMHSPDLAEVLAMIDEIPTIIPAEDDFRWKRYI